MTSVIAVNGSARMAKGYTEQILFPFLEGMKEAGASVETLYTKHLTIKPCTGSFYCWYEKPGQCIYKDDMQTLYLQLREADILILATPVYIPLPGEMQNFINRLCPLIEPVLSHAKGRTRAKLRDDVKISKLALVSACGWWEKGNFSTLLRIVKEIALDMDIEFVGSLLRPHAFLMDENPEEKARIYTACKKVGFQLISKGRMSKRLLGVISQPLISEENLRRRNNKAYQQASRE